MKLGLKNSINQKEVCEKQMIGDFMKKRFEILLSGMYQDDDSIFSKSNIKTNALMINQCDVNEIHQYEQNGKQLRTISTTDRGLSRSRNLAIENAIGDYCLLSDDDEYFVEDLEKKVLTAYEFFPQADVIIFKMNNQPCKLGAKIKKLKKYDCLRVSSVQISFKLSSIKDKIKFDTNLGAGTPNGAGEENKFLLDCYKEGLSIYYVPDEIGAVAQEQSTWFNGYDTKFFFNRGKTTRYVLGLPMATLYAIYFLIFKHKIYKKNISFFCAMKHLFRGLSKKDVNSTF